MKRIWWVALQDRKLVSSDKALDLDRNPGGNQHVLACRSFAFAFVYQSQSNQPG